MKIFTIAILLFTFTASIAQAKTIGYQIIIAKTLKQSTLKQVYIKLDFLKVIAFTQKHKGAYVVYSHRFTEKKNATKTYKKIKKYFKYAKMIELHKKNKIVKKKMQKTDTHTKKIQKKEIVLEKKIQINLHENNLKNNDKNINNMFANIAFGVASVTNDSAGISYNFEVGYNYTDDLFLSLSYLSIATSTLETDNFYGSLNYNYNINPKYDVFAGALLGFGTLELTSFASSEASTSIIFGGQIGTTYKISDYLFAYGEYQMLLTDYFISLVDTGTSVSYDTIHNFQIGISYKF